MKNRIFVIHGWGGGPDKDWMPWITKVLGDKGFEVITPQMPDTDVPVIDAWVNKLNEIIGDIRETDIFIGHSIGCQTILRFLEKLPSDKKIGKVILVAPWFELTNLENNQMWQIANPWIKSQIDFSEVVHKSLSFVTIFSDNDSWVPMDINVKLFKEKLNPEIIILKNKGHFTADEGSTKLPELLNLII
ncbi:MAG: alpha/beta hydrolase [Microgenomates group bacterium]